MGSRTEVSRSGAGTSKVDEDVAAPKAPIELYLVKLSPPCRAVWLYLLQHDIPHVLIDVDFLHKDKAPEFVLKYAHKEVPILVDGEVIVFEGPAILRYLSMQYTNGAGFGMTLPTRMLVESIMSWANGELHRVVGFSYAYPHFLERYQLSSEDANEALVEQGIKGLTKHLEAIDTGYLANNKRYLVGDRITVADSYVATVLLQAEWVGFSFRMWPRVENWLRRVRSQENWVEVHTAHRELVAEIQATPFD